MRYYNQVACIYRLNSTSPETIHHPHLFFSALQATQWLTRWHESYQTSGVGRCLDMARQDIPKFVHSSISQARLKPCSQKAHGMGFLRTCRKFNKWLNDVKGVMGTRCVVVHIQFWGPVRIDPFFFWRWVWVCPYRVVSWLISDWWKVLIVPPVSKIWHKHHEDRSSTVKFLRRNCVLSSPYRDCFCRGSARVPSAAIKCSLRAEETCRHIH